MDLPQGSVILKAGMGRGTGFVIQLAPPSQAGSHNKGVDTILNTRGLESNWGNFGNGVTSLSKPITLPHLQLSQYTLVPNLLMHW